MSVSVCVCLCVYCQTKDTLHNFRHDFVTADSLKFVSQPSNFQLTCDRGLPSALYCTSMFQPRRKPQSSGPIVHHQNANFLLMHVVVNALPSNLAGKE